MWAQTQPKQQQYVEPDEEDKPTARKRAYMKIEEWEPHKEFVLRQRHAKVKEKDILFALRYERGFMVEMHQLKKVLQLWNSKRNLKRKQRDYIVQTVKEREILRGRKNYTIFYHPDGTVIDLAEVKEIMRRYRNSKPAGPPSPDGLIARSPKLHPHEMDFSHDIPDMSLSDGDLMVQPMVHDSTSPESLGSPPYITSFDYSNSTAPHLEIDRFLQQQTTSQPYSNIMGQTALDYPPGSGPMDFAVGSSPEYIVPTLVNESMLHDQFGGYQNIPTSSPPGSAFDYRLHRPTDLAASSIPTGFFAPSPIYDPTGFPVSPPPPPPQVQTPASFGAPHFVPHRVSPGAPPALAPPPQPAQQIYTGGCGALPPSISPAAPGQFSPPSETAGFPRPPVISGAVAPPKAPPSAPRPIISGGAGVPKPPSFGTPRPPPISMPATAPGPPALGPPLLPASVGAPPAPPLPPPMQIQGPSSTGAQPDASADASSKMPAAGFSIFGGSSGLQRKKSSTLMDKVKRAGRGIIGVGASRKQSSATMPAPPMGDYAPGAPIMPPSQPPIQPPSQPPSQPPMIAPTVTQEVAPPTMPQPGPPVVAVIEDTPAKPVVEASSEKIDDLFSMPSDTPVEEQKPASKPPVRRAGRSKAKRVEVDVKNEQEPERRESKRDNIPDTNIVHPEPPAIVSEEAEKVENDEDEEEENFITPLFQTRRRILVSSSNTPFIPDTMDANEDVSLDFEFSKLRLGDETEKLPQNPLKIKGESDQVITTTFGSFEMEELYKSTLNKWIEERTWQAEWDLENEPESFFTKAGVFSDMSIEGAESEPLPPSICSLIKASTEVKSGRDSPQDIPGTKEKEKWWWVLEKHNILWSHMKDTGDKRWTIWDTTTQAIVHGLPDLKERFGLKSFFTLYAISALGSSYLWETLSLPKDGIRLRNFAYKEFEAMGLGKHSFAFESLNDDMNWSSWQDTSRGRYKMVLRRAVTYYRVVREEFRNDTLIGMYAVANMVKALSKVDPQRAAKIIPTATKLLFSFPKDWRNTKEIIVSAAKLGDSMCEVGMLSKAQGLMRGILPAALNQKFGNTAESIPTAILLGSIADCYAAQKRWPRVLELREGILPFFSTILGMEHPNTTVCRNKLREAAEHRGIPVYILPSLKPEWKFVARVSWEGRRRRKFLEYIISQVQSSTV